MVHAAVHARQGHQCRDQDRHDPDDDAQPPAADAGGDQQGDAAVDRDRRRGVARVVAGVGRQMIEPRDVRPLAVDDQCGDAVGRRLDGDRSDDEPRHAPPAHDHRHDGGDRDQRRDRQHVADARQPEGDVVARTVPVVREPHVDVLVGMADAVLGQHVGLEEPTDEHGHGRQQDEPGNRHQDEGEHRVAREPGVGGQRAPSLQERRPVAVGAVTTVPPGGRLIGPNRGGVVNSHDSAMFPVYAVGQTPDMGVSPCCR